MHDITTKPLLVSVDDAAARLCISRRTIYRLVADGKLPQPKKLGKRTLFRMVDLERFVERMK